MGWKPGMNGWNSGLPLLSMHKGTVPSLFLIFFCVRPCPLQIMIDRANLQGQPWEFLSTIDLNIIGFIIVGMFALTWAIALIAWHVVQRRERGEGKEEGGEGGAIMVAEGDEEGGWELLNEGRGEVEGKREVEGEGEGEIRHHSGGAVIVSDSGQQVT